MRERERERESFGPTCFNIFPFFVLIGVLSKSIPPPPPTSGSADWTTRGRRKESTLNEVFFRLEM